MNVLEEMYKADYYRKLGDKLKEVLAFSREDEYLGKIPKDSIEDYMINQIMIPRFHATVDMMVSLLLHTISEFNKEIFKPERR